MAAPLIIGALVTSVITTLRLSMSSARISSAEALAVWLANDWPTVSLRSNTKLVRFDETMLHITLKVSMDMMANAKETLYAIGKRA